jgi:hypothetical protein
MILHTFGDSHCVYPWRNIQIDELSIKTNHLGAKTCASFGFEKLNLNIKNRGVREGDMICFCFGEIDCRSHICKPENFKMYKNLIDEIVSRYFETIKLNVEQYSSLIVMVFNVIPTCKITPIIMFKDPIFPHVGTDEERKCVVMHMNNQLEKYCKEYNYIFFDVYDQYCDKDGFLDLSFSDDSVHITNEIHIKNYIISKVKEVSGYGKI